MLISTYIQLYQQQQNHWHLLSWPKSIVDQNHLSTDA